MENTRTEPIASNPRAARTATQERETASPEEIESFKGRNTKILIFFVAGTLLVGVLAAAALGLGWIHLPGSSPAKKKEVAPLAVTIGPMLKINPLVVNLREEGGRHYVKIAIILEIGRPEWLEEVRPQSPFLADLAILTLSDKRLKELQEVEAKENLKKELLLKITQALGSEKVTKIYFDEFLLQ